MDGAVKPDELHAAALEEMLNSLSLSEKRVGND